MGKPISPSCKLRNGLGRGVNVAGSSPTGGILAQLRECVIVYMKLHICPKMQPAVGRPRDLDTCGPVYYASYEKTPVLLTYNRNSGLPLSGALRYFAVIERAHVFDR